MRPLSYPGTDIFVLMFCLVDTKSLSNLKNRFIPEIQHHCPNTPFVIVGAKLDLFEDEDYMEKKNLNKELIQDQIQNFRSLHSTVPYFEISSKIGVNLEETISGAVRYALELQNKPNENKKECILS